MSRTRMAASLAAALAVPLAIVLAVSCSKSAGSGKEAPKPATGPEVIAVPGATAPVTGGAGERGAGPTAADTAFRLKPEEGKLSIDLPPDAQAGAETTARVVVTPGPKFKINFEYPTKLSLEPPAQVTLSKAELKAGGPSQAKGDADVFEEKQLVFAVKLTPTASGSHKINGSFKFAVCDKDQCLAKREPIEIQVAAK